MMKTVFTITNLLLILAVSYLGVELFNKKTNPEALSPSVSDVSKTQSNNIAQKAIKKIVSQKPRYQVLQKENYHQGRAVHYHLLNNVCG